jgi:hypothetical protein
MCSKEIDHLSISQQMVQIRLFQRNSPHEIIHQAYSCGCTVEGKIEIDYACTNIAVNFKFGILIIVNM